MLNEIIKIPTRATKGSAGYDIVTPFDIDLKVGESMKVPTGLKCKVDNGWFLGIFPKSGLGFKYSLRLGNSIGVIDEDYYFADNEGHIFVKIKNCSPNTLEIKKGEAFCQGVFTLYGVADREEVTEERTGGIGSTGK